MNTITMVTLKQSWVNTIIFTLLLSTSSFAYLYYTNKDVISNMEKENKQLYSTCDRLKGELMERKLVEQLLVERVGKVEDYNKDNREDIIKIKTTINKQDSDIYRLEQTNIEITNKVVRVLDKILDSVREKNKVK